MKLKRISDRQLAVMVFTVRTLELPKAPVVYFETQNTDPVLFTLGFLGNSPLLPSGCDWQSVSYCLDQIVVAVDLCIYFSTCHADILWDM